MSAYVPIAAARTRGPVADLLERQRALALYGGLTLALALLTFALQFLDPRLLASGISVWTKPAKFFSSVAIFSITMAWFFGYVRPERRASRAMKRTVVILIAAGTFELAWISWQGAHGLESHFNRDTLFFLVMYGLMGLGALLLVGTTLPLAWEIAKRPAAGLAPDFVAAVVAGLVLTFLLGGGFGIYLSAQAGHSVGATGGHVPLFGWNRSGGDLRIAHFLGIHAQQALPVLAALMAGFAARVRWAALIGGGALYVAVTVALFVQAVNGAPLLPLVKG